MRQRISIVGGLLALGLLAAPAQAAIVTLEFSGFAQNGATLPDPSRPYAGFLTYDTETPVSCAECVAPGNYGYGSAGHLEVTYGGIFFATDDLFISVRKYDDGDQLFFAGPLGSVSLAFFDPTGAALADLSLPAVIPTGLGSWSFLVTPQSSRDPVFFDARTQVTQVFSGAVPEPGAWALMLLGFGVVGGLARSRRGAPLPLPK